MNYSVLYLPEDLESLDQFTFREEQIQSNRLWKIANTHYYILGAEKQFKSIASTVRTKDTIDFLYNHLDEKQMKKIADYFLRKSMLTSVKFDGELSGLDNLELISQMRFKVLSQIMTEEDVQKGLSDLNYIVEERYGQVRVISIAVKVEGKMREFEMRTNGGINPIGIETEGTLDAILSLYEDLLINLWGVTDPLEEYMLPPHETVIHPLAKQHAALLNLFEVAGDKVREEMGLTEKEWELIRTDLERHSIESKDLITYKHEAEKLKVELTV